MMITVVVYMGNITIGKNMMVNSATHFTSGVGGTPTGGC